MTCRWMSLSITQILSLPHIKCGAHHSVVIHNKNDSLLEIEVLEHVRPLDRGDRIRRLNQRVFLDSSTGCA